MTYSNCVAALTRPSLRHKAPMAQPFRLSPGATDAALARDLLSDVLSGPGAMVPDLESLFDWAEARA